MFTFVHIAALISRGEVHEDDFGLKDTFWSPWPRRSSLWPWSRGLKSSIIALSSVWEQHYFLNFENYVDRLKKFFKNVLFRKMPEKVFLKTFFFSGEHLHLCPWSLASRGSVLVRAVLGLGFFLCSWPWFWALCPRLHLCSSKALCASDFFCIKLITLALNVCCIPLYTKVFHHFQIWL